MAPDAPVGLRRHDTDMANESPCVWEQRWHPFREEWVLFTSHRGGRPWIGDTHPPRETALPSYDPSCALCPGNPRLGGANPRVHRSVLVYQRPAVLFRRALSRLKETHFYRTRRASGTAEVVCYHPDHGKTFADLSDDETQNVVDLWAERYSLLGARPEVDHILIFENKGTLVGTSNPHPHCQIYAGNMVYGTIASEVASGRRFFKETGRLLGQEVLEREAAGPRVVACNDSFLACVPWFARYAYEVFILPSRAAASLADLTASERTAAWAE